MAARLTPALFLALLIALPPPLRAADTVVLDLVVRDKKGAALVDLAPTDVEVYEEGAKQTVTDFRRADTSGPRPVALVFPGLGSEERVLAQAAVDELVKKQINGLTLAVFNLGSELVPVQEFTTDPALVKAAVKRALDTRARAGFPEAHVLYSLVDGLKAVPGRKTVVLFTAGLALPAGVEDLVGSLAGFANRNRVTFYGFDPRGVAVSTKTDPAAVDGSVMTEVWIRGAGLGHDDLRGYGVNVDKDRPDASPAALGRLASLTGGFVSERTNNVSRPVREIAEDARGYYEVSYVPAGPVTEGQLRKTEVKVAREGAQVQARQGYVLGDAGPPLTAFEKRLADALAAEPLARDVEMWDRVLRFDWDGQQATQVLCVAVPLAKVALASDTQAGKFAGNVSVLARVKDASGKVVATFSRPFPLNGPLDQKARAQEQTIPFLRRVKLAPGSYTLETAVRDEGGDKTTARRTSFEIRPASGVAMSSLSLGDLVPAADADSGDPLRIGAQRLVPNVGQPIKAGKASMTLYSVVYPAKDVKEPPTMTITLLFGDEVANTATTKLPAPDASGKIPYSTALRMDVLPPGPYRVKVGVSQGSTHAEESVAFTIAP
jgi:VWFA-related protein